MWLLQVQEQQPINVENFNQYFDWPQWWLQIILVVAGCALWDGIKELESRRRQRSRARERKGSEHRGAGTRRLE